MEFKIWMIWMGLAALCIVGEMFTAGFFLLWFGIGAAIAGVLALLGLGAAWQWTAFIVVSGVLFVQSRRFAERITKRQPDGIGADRAIGKVGLVLEAIDNAKNTGRVRLEKEEWNADCESDAIIAEGERVIVTRLEGAHLVVKLFTEGV